MQSRFLKALAFTLVHSALVVSVANAGPDRRQSDKILQQSEEVRYVRITGSNLPQKVKVKSIGTDTPYNIRIYTRRELESTGRITLGDALTLDPSIQLSGRH